MPDVTVVVPTRDRWPLLRQALRTVLAQRDVEVEAVVVDDGSRDGTAEHLARLGDARVRVVRHDTPQGVSAARNAGLAAASGEWAALLDDDDLWTPDKLAAQLSALHEEGRSWAYAGAVTFGDGPVLWARMNPPRPEEAAARLPWKNVVPAGASNVVVRRDVALRLGGFDTTLQHLADWDLWLRLLEDGPPAVAYVHAVAYRQHGSMQTQPAGILDELAVVDRRYRRLRGGAGLDVAPTLRWIARSHLRSGRRGEARRAFLAAFREGTHHAPRDALGALRALVPVRPFPGRVRDRLRGRVTHEWPAGMEQWLREALR